MKGRMREKLTFGRLSFISVLIRGFLILYGEWQDRNFKVKFTDVDYVVFTDAARLILEGTSPFRRATYRYTPLLALLMTPNVLFFSSFGKIVFALCDLVVGCLIFRLLKIRNLDNFTSVCCTCCWLLNPIAFGVSTRGNAESLICVTVLGSLFMLETNRVFASGLLLGGAIHLKIYPVLYTLPMYLWLSDDNESFVGLYTGLLLRMIPNRQQLTLALSTVGSFTALTYFCYTWCDQPYLDEAWIYHIRRTDNRHNFSVYFYPLYLTFGSPLAKAVGLLAFLPQVVLTLLIGATVFRDLPLAMFLQTFVFVMFNKVCTSQYFLWYICLLPLVMHPKATTLSAYDCLAMVVMWFGGQAMWLVPAYYLEFEGVQMFISLWISSVVFLCANAWIVGNFVNKAVVLPSPSKH
eukprot:CFRG0287T1